MGKSESNNSFRQGNDMWKVAQSFTIANFKD